MCAGITIQKVNKNILFVFDLQTKQHILTVFLVNTADEIRLIDTSPERAILLSVIYNQAVYLLRLLYIYLYVYIFDFCSIMYMQQKAREKAFIKNYLHMQEAIIILVNNDLAKPAAWKRRLTPEELKYKKKRPYKKRNITNIKPRVIDDGLTSEQRWLRLEEKYCLANWRHIEHVKAADLYKAKFDNMTDAEIMVLIKNFFIEDRVDVLTHKQRKKWFKSQEQKHHDVNEVAYWRKFLKKFFSTEKIPMKKHPDLERFFLTIYK